MANADHPRGFRCLGTKSGRYPVMQLCYIPSTDSTAVFVGDAVKIAGSADGSGRPTVAQCAATNAIYGIVDSIDQVKDVGDANFSLYRTHRPASIGMYVNVIIDPDAIYAIQCDDVGSTLAAADIGLNASIIVGSGDTVTGWSGMELDTSTKATTATLELKIIGIEKRPDNALGSANQDAIVVINNHQLGSHTGTAGV